MAMPLPHSILNNFFQPLILYAEVYHHDYQKQTVLPSPAKHHTFSKFLQRFRSGGWASKKEVDNIVSSSPIFTKVEVHTVLLESLESLENCAASTKGQSAVLGREILLSIRRRSEKYLTELDGILTEEAEEVRTLHYRASIAAQTLLSLEEVPLPPLPDDLLRCIFLWVACQSTSGAKQLSLVSLVIQNWVDPYIFKYLAHTIGIEHASSSRMLRAKEKYFIGCTLLHPPRLALGYARIFQELPVLRSVVTSGTHVAHISAIKTPSFRRIHIDDWTSTDSPLSYNVFSTITHLSLNTRTPRGLIHDWEWTPLKYLVALRYFMLHTYTFPERGFYPNTIHAPLWINVMSQQLFPCIPTSVQLVVWVLPDIDIRSSLSHYQVLLDGTAHPRFVVAFEEGDGLRTHATSESTGAGGSAFVYPMLKAHRAGLDWLEWLWKEALVFLKNRERAATQDKI
ncbi:hypothetical protein DL96DRAFT_1817076 [Flagelloscypha sp. PMI_526]|nr:hypothetical protein DL96DRAFT_1817076 [Flagelloscypha sp. PMI_526]